MIKVEEIIEKYKGYEVDEEKLKEFLTPPKPKTVYELKKVKSSQNEEYFILYDFVDKKVAIYPSGGVCYQGTIYFTSYALAQRAIKEAGEDNIKNYIFRVDVECVKKG